MINLTIKKQNFQFLLFFIVIIFLKIFLNSFFNLYLYTISKICVLKNIARLRGVVIEVSVQ